MMRVETNGVYRDATPEEEAAFLALTAEEDAVIQPSTEERMAKLEAKNVMLTNCILELAKIIGGEEG